MAKKLLESAFIDILDIESEEFQQRKYFLYRWAVYIEKQIGVKKGTRVAKLVTFEDLKSTLPMAVIKVVAVFPSNPLALNPEEYKDFDLVKNIVKNYTSIRFVEQGDQILVGHSISTATIIIDILEKDEFGRHIVEEDHLPAITAFIKFKIVEKEKLKAALKGEQRYYMLQREKLELDQDYNRHIINARSNERFEEVKEVQEPNEIMYEDDELNHSF